MGLKVNFPTYSKEPVEFFNNFYFLNLKLC